ncbi:MAG TPA: DUF1629 domain-containing protein [Rhizomicrobium sp.]|jgi:hypothetical protein|nr:DUF1629 domain-containing protein [Rhizomicrobium sp.]
MAYIIGDDYEAEFIDTEIVFTDGDKALKAFFAKTYIAPDTILKASWFTGNPIPPEVVPAKARIVEGGALYDWRTVTGGPTLVSASFKACVEALDPGRHGFFPLIVEERNGDVLPGPHFLFNVVGCIDSIIEEQSNLKAIGRGQVDRWAYERAAGPWKCALDASVIGGRACWTELRYGGRWFISDRLANLLRERGLSGFDYKQICEEV